VNQVGKQVAKIVGVIVLAIFVLVILPVTIALLLP